MKNKMEILVEKLRLNIVPERLWKHILVDFITKLLVFRGYDLILVVYDRFLKMLHFIAITEKITAESLARLFRNNIWKLYRLPVSKLKIADLVFLFYISLLFSFYFWVRS